MTEDTKLAGWWAWDLDTDSLALEPLSINKTHSMTEHLVWHYERYALSGLWVICGSGALQQSVIAIIIIQLP